MDGEIVIQDDTTEVFHRSKKLLLEQPYTFPPILIKSTQMAGFRFPQHNRSLHHLTVQWGSSIMVFHLICVLSVYFLRKCTTAGTYY